MGKTGQLGNHRPKQLDQPLAQPAQGNDVGRPAGREIRLAQRLIVGQGQRSLGHQDKDFFGRDACIEQVQQAPYPGGCFSAACRTLQKQRPFNWAVDYLKLVSGKS